MNVKKILTILLAVFLLTAVCCGAASAFTVTKEASINPSGSLVPGQSVTGTMEIKLSKGSVNDASSVSFNTPLVGDVWNVDIIKGGVVVLPKTLSSSSNRDFSISITGFDLNYDSDVTLRINMSGKVPSTVSNTKISVIQIKSYEVSTNSNYESTPQFVYNTGNLNGELSVLGNDISSIDTRIAAYLDLERDVGKAQTYNEQARAKYSSAQSAGTADAINAFKYIEEGEALVKKAQMELALCALSMSLSYTGAVDNTITTLYSKGWNNEAMLLDTKNTGLKNTYSQLFATYNAGNAPDAAALDKLAADSLALWEEGNTYLESANNPLGGLLKYLPFILIGVGVVVVGVVVFLLVRRRKNSWDELG